MKTRTFGLVQVVLMLSLFATLPAVFPAHATGDFTIGAKPSNLGRIFADTPIRVTINVTSTGGFAGTVSLSGYNYNGQGVTLSFNPASVTVTSGGSATSTLTLTVSCDPSGQPPVTVQGTSGALAHDTYITWGIVVC